MDDEHRGYVLISGVTLGSRLEQGVKKILGLTGTEKMTSSTNLASGVLAVATVVPSTSSQRHVLQMRRSLGSLVHASRVLQRMMVCTLQARWKGFGVAFAHHVCASVSLHVATH